MFVYVCVCVCAVGLFKGACLQCELVWCGLLLLRASMLACVCMRCVCALFVLDCVILYGLFRVFVLICVFV